MAWLAPHVRRLDPRLKMGLALVLGPMAWLFPPLGVALLLAVLVPLVVGLAASQPLGSKMVRSLGLFIVFWIAMKAGIDAISGVPFMELLMAAAVLGLRLAALLMVGLGLSLSTSARSLGMALSWIIRPLVGGERAWKVALSLSLMVHFLPLCLSTLNQIKETVSNRCPHMGRAGRTLLIPQAMLRALGQKTWNQTLAVAGRGLDNEGAWEPDFVWSGRDTVCGLVGVACTTLFFFL